MTRSANLLKLVSAELNDLRRSDDDADFCVTGGNIKSLRSIIIIIVVVVDPGTLAKCQCTPLPTRWYNHGEVASTILELHCNSIAAPLGAGVDCYLTGILIFTRDQVIRVVSQNHWWEWLPSHKKEAGEKCLHLHPCWMTDRPRVGEDFRRHHKLFVVCIQLKLGFREGNIFSNAEKIKSQTT